MPQLLSNQDELKENFAALDVNADFIAFKQFIQDAEDLISETVDDSTITWFASQKETANPIISKALRYLTRANSYIGIYMWTQTAMFKFSQKALYIVKMSDGAIISDKKFEDLTRYCRESGFDFLDKALAIMEANLDIFPEYADSTARSTSLRYFIRTAKEFSGYKNINNSHLTFLSLLDIITRVQKNSIRNYMGEDFFDSYQERFLEDDFNADDYKLLPYVQEAVALLTVAQAFKEKNVQVRGDGMFVNSFESRSEYSQQTPVNQNVHADTMQEYFRLGEQSLQKLRAYLNKNAAKFAGYVADPLTPTIVNTKDSSLYIF